MTSIRPLLPFVLGLALVSAPAVLAGCDSTATIFKRRVLFQEAQIISAFPGSRQGDGSWTRQCGVGPVDGIITSVAFISTQPQVAPGADASDADRNQGIGPLDVIDSRTIEGGLPDDINLTNTGNLGLTIDCIDPQPQPNPGGGGCQGAVPSAALDAVEYKSTVSGRRDGHNVLILIDQSGSVGGLVDSDNGNKEDRPGDFIPLQNFGSLASDRNSLRIASARKFIRLLNSEDRFGLLAFGEGLAQNQGLLVPCTESLGSVTEDLNNCFGKTNQSIWLSSGGIDSLQGQTEGRSNLWSAVDEAYDYLRNEVADTKRSNHIVVLTDGPDTCAPGENLGACQSGCSITDAQDFVTKLNADNNDPNAVRIQVHFIQFESLGYDGRDPRQVEAACLSGGTYQYINNNDFPREQSEPFQAALDAAVANVRFILNGHWELGASVPAYTSNAGAPTGTPAGSLYAINGILTVSASSNMVPSNQPFPFGIGTGEGADAAVSWDRRPSFRKPCGAPTDCGAPGAGGACQIICSAETLTCPGGATGITAPDISSCELSGGGTGFCCQGSCETGGTCAACTQ